MNVKDKPKRLRKETSYVMPKFVMRKSWSNVRRRNRRAIRKEATVIEKYIMEFQDYITRLENTNEGRRPKIGEEEIARGEQRVQPEATRTPVPATPTDNQEKQSSNMVGSAFGLLDHVRLGTNSSMLLA